MRRTTALVTAALVFGILISMPAHALAFEQRTGDNITVDTAVSDDLYVFGTNIEISGRIDGDVIAFGQIIRISGDVTGDVITAGQSVTVSGPVGGSVRAAGADVSIQALVTDDVLAAGNNVRLTQQGAVFRDAVLAGSTVEIAGKVVRNVLAGAGRLSVKAPVGGDLTADVERLVISEDGSVAGDVTYYSNNEARIQGDVGGETNQYPARVDDSRAEEPSAAVAVMFGILGWVRALIGMALFALLVLLAARRLTERAAWEAWYGRPLISGAIGLAVFVAAFPVAMLVFLIGLLVGGWWIAFVWLGVVWLLMLVGIVVAALALGSWLIHVIAHRTVHPMLAAVLGVLVLAVVAAVPFIGWLGYFVAMLMGAGAVLVTLYGTAGATRTPAVVASQSPETPVPQAPETL